MWYYYEVDDGLWSVNGLVCASESQANCTCVDGSSVTTVNDTYYGAIYLEIDCSSFN